MEHLTEKQTEILNYLISCIRDEHYTPTVREIASRFGFSSTNGVRDHLLALERKGCIQRRVGASRGIELAPSYLREPDEEGIPIIGRVAAGQPITAIENMEGRLTIESLFSRPESLYALEVHGDSMIQAGILDGDFVIVREQNFIEDNAIGVAILDEEATVKRIRIRDNEAHLIAENPLYPPLIVDLMDTPFRIGGKVVGVHRVVK